MNGFKERSAEKELIDEAGVPFADWEVCLHELNMVNTYLGGHAITVEGMKKLLANTGDRTITVAEIGCGGGDNLKAIHRNIHGRPMRYIGVDINKACTDFAAKNCSFLPSAQFICSDYRLVDLGNDKPDIIFNSLFCHHFTNEQLVEMLQWMKINSRVGFFINDLQRHPVAYYSIKLLTKLFSKSYLVKNDAPISVSKGFIKREWEDLLQRAGIQHYSIKWRWAFRYLVIANNE
jgi:SAM-dependent methyltransferase